MRRLLVVLLVVCFATYAFGTDLGRVGPTPDMSKGNDHVMKNPGTPDGREGGETIATALPILAVPFYDTGNTCDNYNDYDEECPYTGSTSPDVVYSISGPGIFDFDLCTSLYDTKMYIYDGAMGLVACNDDYYFDATCGVYVSFLGMVPLGAGTYYVVIDGYGGDCGDYVLNVDEFEECDVICHEEAVLEGEPDLVPNYYDSHNGGCNTTPNVFQALHWINEASPDGCGWLCGESGWYTYAGLNYRDTDWFLVTAAGTEISWTVEAEYPVNMFVLPPECPVTVALYSLSILDCTPGTITFPTSPGEQFYLWVGPQDFTGPVSMFEYTLELCGAWYDTIPAEEETWGGVKAMFR